MMALGDNIRKLREERGMTQQQMADKLYVSRQTVCRWENGSRCPDLITAKKIATEFGVSLDALISDDDMEDLERISGAGKFINKGRYWNLSRYWEAYTCPSPLFCGFALTCGCRPGALSWACAWW